MIRTNFYNTRTLIKRSKLYYVIYKRHKQRRLFMKFFHNLNLLLVTFTIIFSILFAKSDLAKFESYSLKENGCILESTTGQRIFLRPYTNHMIRLQFVRPGHKFFSDDHYEMIVDHNMGGSIIVDEKFRKLIIETESPDGIRIEVDKNPLHFSFYDKNTDKLLLEERDGLQWEGSIIKQDFKPTKSEHFLGLGQKPLGYQEHVDLQGVSTSRNYGEFSIPGRGAQGNLLVPFFMSSKGYGLYMNSTFPNDFSFNHNGEYYISFDTQGAEGQMDFVFIKGPKLPDILDRYTQLTGRPRMIPKSMFGLHLSDNDPRIDGKPIDHKWWKQMINEHRKAGFPLDHAVFDNDWRPGLTPDRDGQWSGSKFEFNYERFPDPQAFGNFLDELGITLTLDLNLNNCNDSWGWRPEYNISVVENCPDDNSDSYPDYTDPEVRNWVWQLFWNKALNPELDYPCDGLWIDEVDGVWNQCVPDSTILSNGRTWGEMKNYYYFLVAKAIAQEGWINENESGGHSIGESKRPYIWLRGGTAGGQRYGTHWTGDIHFTQDALQGQIISMQASGLSGYPFFNHDAGGFVEDEPGPSDSLYIQWAMAFGSFTPIWRPHGYGRPRWPLNRSKACQQAAMKYGKLRYKLMPYIYTMAHIANQTGIPMARSMSLVYPDSKEAWEHELQYLWGSEMLIAPGLNLAGKDSVQNIWLPKENDWYYCWDDEKIDGGQIIKHKAIYGELPIFIKTGAIIPKRKYAKSTFWLSDRFLILDVYSGSDGEFILQEDDGVSERYMTKDEIRKTKITYEDSAQKLVIHPAYGTYKGAAKNRKYKVRIHGLKNPKKVTLNGQEIDLTKSGEDTKNPEYAEWEKGTLSIKSRSYPVKDKLTITVE